MKIILINFTLLIIILSSCSSAKVRNYYDPAQDFSKLNSIAILPLRNSFVQTNTSLNTGDMIEINKMFQQEFIKKNPRLKVSDSKSSTELLNKNQLVEPYANMLSTFHQTGIPNTDILKKIGTLINADAIFQGFVTECIQNDGVYGRVNAETSVKVRYILFSTSTGSVIWEATCEGQKKLGTLGNAPPISEVLTKIKKNLIPAIPVLSNLK